MTKHVIVGTSDGSKVILNSRPFINKEIADEIASNLNEYYNPWGYLGEPNFWVKEDNNAT